MSKNQSPGSSSNVMPKQWYRVAIHTNEISAADQSATSLIEGLETAYRAAGAPDGVADYFQAASQRLEALFHSRAPLTANTPSPFNSVTNPA